MANFLMHLIMNEAGKLTIMDGRNLRGRAVLAWVIMLICFFSIGLTIYGKALTAPLTFDDAAISLYFASPDFGWIDCFLPLENGFIRPYTILVFKVIWQAVGMSPLWYHLTEILLHCFVAVSAAFVFHIFTGTRILKAALVGLTVLLSSAAFPVVYMLSNSCDGFMALGILLSIIQWYLWLNTGHRRNLVYLIACLLIAIGGKESAVIVGGIVLLQTWVERPVRKYAWGISMSIFVLCFGYALFVSYLQSSNDQSYASSGWVSYNPVFISSKIPKYLAAVVFPGSFIMEPFWNLGFAGRVFEFVIRGVAAVLVLVSIGVVVLRCGDRMVQQAGVFYMGAVGVLLPTSILTLPTGPFSPTGRFLYGAIPLVVMAGACLVWRFWPKGLAARTALIAVWVVWLGMQAVIVRSSPGTIEYYETSREWGKFVDEIGRVSAGWPPMQAVTVYTGPEYGGRVIPERYGMALFRLFYPKLLANYYANRLIPETTLVYVFDGSVLRLVEGSE